MVQMIFNSYHMMLLKTLTRTNSCYLHFNFLVIKLINSKQWENTDLIILIKNIPFNYFMFTS